MESATSAVFLAMGFGFTLAAYFLYARITGVVGDDGAQIVLPGLAACYRLILFKGLLPQLVLVLALWLPLSLRWPTARTSPPRRLLAICFVATVAYGLVAPLLLTTNFDGLPALQMNRLSDHASTAALMIAAVSLAMWLSTLRRRRPRP
jgi:hypothetical protein